MRVPALLLLAAALPAQTDLLPLPTHDAHLTRAARRLAHAHPGFALPAHRDRGVRMVLTECEEAMVCVPKARHEAGNAPPGASYTVRKLQPGWCGCDIWSACGLVFGCDVDFDAHVPVSHPKCYRWKVGDLPQSSCLCPEQGQSVTISQRVVMQGCGIKSPLIQIWLYDGGNCDGDPAYYWLQWECEGKATDCDSLSCAPLP